MVCGTVRPAQFSGLGRNMAPRIRWVRKIHKTGILYFDNGLSWKCDNAIDLRTLCRYIRPSHCLLGISTLLFIPRILCISWLPFKKVVLKRDSCNYKIKLYLKNNAEFKKQTIKDIQWQNNYSIPFDRKRCS